MAAVAGLRGSGDFATDERPKDFRNYILWRNPMGTAPFMALLGRMAKDAPADPEFSWWDEPNDIIRLVVNYSTGYASNATSIVVVGTDPTAGANAGLVYGSAQHLKPGDLLQVESASMTTTYAPEIVMVSSVSSATALDIKRGVAGSTPASIDDEVALVKVGNAYGEGTKAPLATSRNPMKYTNLCQIFKTTYEITNTAKGIKNLRTGDALQNDKKRKTWDHSRDLELAFLWGLKYEDTDPTNNKPRRFTGGLRSFIPLSNTTIFATSPTETTFLDAVYPVFNWDTPAGDQRLMLCGNGFLNTMNVLAKEGTQIQANGVVKQYGMNLREWTLPQGTLYMRTHPLFNRHPVWTNCAFIIDGSANRYRAYRDTFNKDNIQDNDEDLQKGQWLTEAGLEVRYGGLTQGFIGNFVI